MKSVGKLIDTVKEIPQKAMRWLLSYGISPSRDRKVWYLLVSIEATVNIN